MRARQVPKGALPCTRMVADHTAHHRCAAGRLPGPLNPLQRRVAQRWTGACAGGSSAPSREVSPRRHRDLHKGSPQGKADSLAAPPCGGRLCLMRDRPIKVFGLVMFYMLTIDCCIFVGAMVYLTASNLFPVPAGLPAALPTKVPSPTPSPRPPLLRHQHLLLSR